MAGKKVMRKKILIIALIITLLLISLNVSGQIHSAKESSTDDWHQINEDGFGSIFNIGPRGIETFNDSLIVGTANYNDKSTFMMGKEYPLQSFFSAIKDGSNYDTFCSNGCEIWAYNGSEWKVLVGNSKDAIMQGGFGNKNNIEVGFIKVFDGYLYAGLRNEIEGGQIWRTKSINEEWEQVVTDGFEDENNVWCMSAEVFKNYLYAGTYNRNGCEIFRTNDGINWDAVVGDDSNTKAGFESRGIGAKTNFYTWSMCVYRDELYVGTPSCGGELWKTEDGLKWTPVIAYATKLQAKLNGAYYSRGFGSSSMGGIRRLIVYNDELYLFSAVQHDFNFFIIKGLGNFIEKLTRKINLPSFPLRYHYSGTQIWKFNADKEEWTRVIGGFGKENTCAGFGDSNNKYLWSVEVHDGYLYVGTGHPNAMNIVFSRKSFFNWSACLEIPKGKGELWRYDGENWEQFNEDGFGDEYNLGIRVLKEFNNNLFAGTMNIKTGLEVWKCDFSGE